MADRPPSMTPGSDPYPTEESDDVEVVEPQISEPDIELGSGIHLPSDSPPSQDEGVGISASLDIDTEGDKEYQKTAEQVQKDLDEEVYSVDVAESILEEARAEEDLREEEREETYQLMEEQAELADLTPITVHGGIYWDKETQSYLSGDQEKSEAYVEELAGKTEAPVLLAVPEPKPELKDVDTDEAAIVLSQEDYDDYLDIQENFRTAGWVGTDDLLDPFKAIRGGASTNDLVLLGLTQAEVTRFRQNVEHTDKLKAQFPGLVDEDGFDAQGILMAGGKADDLRKAGLTTAQVAEVIKNVTKFRQDSARIVAENRAIEEENRRLQAEYEAKLAKYEAKQEVFDDTFEKYEDYQIVDRMDGSGMRDTTGLNIVQMVVDAGPGSAEVLKDLRILGYDGGTIHRAFNQAEELKALQAEQSRIQSATALVSPYISSENTVTADSIIAGLAHPDIDVKTFTTAGFDKEFIEDVQSYKDFYIEPVYDLDGILLVKEGVLDTTAIVRSGKFSKEKLYNSFGEEAVLAEQSRFEIEKAGGLIEFLKNTPERDMPRTTAVLAKFEPELVKDLQDISRYIGKDGSIDIVEARKTISDDVLTNPEYNIISATSLAQFDKDTRNHQEVIDTLIAQGYVADPQTGNYRLEQPIAPPPVTHQETSEIDPGDLGKGMAWEQFLVNHSREWAEYYQNKKDGIESEKPTNEEVVDPATLKALIAAGIVEASPEQLMAGGLDLVEAEELGVTGKGTWGHLASFGMDLIPVVGTARLIIRSLEDGKLSKSEIAWIAGSTALDVFTVMTLGAGSALTVPLKATAMRAGQKGFLKAATSSAIGAITSPKTVVMAHNWGQFVAEVGRMPTVLATLGAKVVTAPIRFGHQGTRAFVRSAAPKVVQPESLTPKFRAFIETSKSKAAKLSGVVRPTRWKGGPAYQPRTIKEAITGVIEEIPESDLAPHGWKTVIKLGKRVKVPKTPYGVHPVTKLPTKTKLDMFKEIQEVGTGPVKAQVGKPFAEGVKEIPIETVSGPGSVAGTLTEMVSEVGRKVVGKPTAPAEAAKFVVKAVAKDIGATAKGTWQIPIPTIAKGAAGEIGTSLRHPLQSLKATGEVLIGRRILNPRDLRLYERATMEVGHQIADHIGGLSAQTGKVLQVEEVIKPSFVPSKQTIEANGFVPHYFTDVHGKQQIDGWYQVRDATTDELLRVTVVKDVETAQPHLEVRRRQTEVPRSDDEGFTGLGPDDPPQPGSIRWKEGEEVPLLEDPWKVPTGRVSIEDLIKATEGAEIRIIQPTDEFAMSGGPSFRVGPDETFSVSGLQLTRQEIGTLQSMVDQPLYSLTTKELEALQSAVQEAKATSGIVRLGDTDVPDFERGWYKWEQFRRAPRVPGPEVGTFRPTGLKDVKGADLPVRFVPGKGWVADSDEYTYTDATPGDDVQRRLIDVDPGKAPGRVVTPTITPTITPTRTPIFTPEPQKDPSRTPSPSKPLPGRPFPRPPGVPGKEPGRTPFITPYVTPGSRPSPGFRPTPFKSPVVGPTGPAGPAPGKTPVFDPTISPTITPGVTPGITPKVTPTISPSTGEPKISPTIKPIIGPITGTPTGTVTDLALTTGTITGAKISTVPSLAVEPLEVVQPKLSLELETLKPTKVKRRTRLRTKIKRRKVKLKKPDRELDEPEKGQIVLLSIQGFPIGSGRGVPTNRKIKVGKFISISASANKGWKFDHWEGDIEPQHVNKKRANVLMDDDRFITAVFVPSGKGDETYIHKFYPTALKTRKHSEVARLTGRADKKSDRTGFTA